MKSIQEFITEATNGISFKTSNYLPKNIKYADKVKIKKNEYILFIIECSDGYACCAYNPAEKISKYIYLNTIDNILKHFEYIFNTGKTIKDAKLGPDGELSIGTKTIKKNLALKYQNEIIKSSTNAHSIFLQEGDADGLFYKLKNYNKSKGIWAISHDNYINKKTINSDNVKICVDNEWFDGHASYGDILPNEKLQIEKGDQLVVLKDKMFSKVDKNNINYLFAPNTKSILIIIADKNFITDGGNFILCKFVKFENNILYLTKSMEKYKLNYSDISQIIGDF